MINRMEKIYSPQDSRVALKVYQGHFAAPHSHVTHYFDLTTRNSFWQQAFLP